MTDLPINTVILGEAISTLQTYPDNSVDFVFTDPPYGHNNMDNDLNSIQYRVGPSGYDMRGKRGGKKGDPTERALPILNDGIEANDLFRAILPELFRILKPGSCCCCCCGGGGPDPQFARWSLWMDEVFAFKQMVVWDKGWGLGWHYRRCYEVILVGEKTGAACRWFDETKAVKNIIRYGELGATFTAKTKSHPTEKPIGLAAHFIKLHTQPGDIVLDPFCGSGSTLIAAKNNWRKYIGIELDPKWHKHTTNRLAQDTDELPLYTKTTDDYPIPTATRMHPGKPRKF